MLNVCCFAVPLLRLTDFFTFAQSHQTKWPLNLMIIAKADEMILLVLTVLMTKDTNPSIFSMQIFVCFDKMKRSLL